MAAQKNASIPVISIGVSIATLIAVIIFARVSQSHLMEDADAASLQLRLGTPIAETMLCKGVTIYPELYTATFYNSPAHVFASVPEELRNPSYKPIKMLRSEQVYIIAANIKDGHIFPYVAISGDSSLRLNDLTSSFRFFAKSSDLRASCKDAPASSATIDADMLAKKIDAAAGVESLRSSYTSALQQKIAAQQPSQAAVVQQTPAPAPTVAGAQTYDNLYNRAKDQFDHRNYAASLGLFDAACYRGDLRSCNYLGYQYAKGLGTPRNEMFAVTIYKANCQKGNNSSCVSLATLFASHGQTAAARALYQKACAGGMQEACRY